MDSNVVTSDELIGEVWFQLHDLIVDENLNTTSADLQVPVCLSACLLLALPVSCAGLLCLTACMGST
jgi:hypothetical protein